MKRVWKRHFKALTLVGALLLASCGGEPVAEQKGAEEGEKRVIRIGTTVGDFADMVTDYIKPHLDEQGYRVELVEFTDYILPNRALADRSIDINTFQHKPYFDSFTTSHRLDLVTLFQIPTGPLGLYPGKEGDLEAVKEREVSVAVPNDPSNYARTLILLEEVGWITIKEGVDPLKAGRGDIASNPYNIKLVEIEAPQLPRTRVDVDYVVIPGNYAASSKIPFTEALFTDPSFDFINWAAIRKEDEGKQWVKDVEAAYNSDGFKEYAKVRFAGYKYPEIWGERE